MALAGFGKLNDLVCYRLLDVVIASGLSLAGGQSPGRGYNFNM